MILRTREFLVSFSKDKDGDFTSTFQMDDDKLTNLIKCLQEFKSSMEFRNCDSNSDKVKLNESVRKGLAEIYEDKTEAFGPVLVSENPCRDLDDINEIDLRKYQVKVMTEKEQIKRRHSRIQEIVKNFRQKFSEAVTTGRRSGSGQIAIDYYDELVKIWGGSPVSEPLSYGTNTTCFNDHMNADNFSDNTSSSSSHSLSNNNPYDYRHSSNSTLPKRKISIDRNEEYLDTDGYVGFIDEANSSNESLKENASLPVSKSTPVNNKKKEIKKKY